MLKLPTGFNSYIAATSTTLLARGRSAVSLDVRADHVRAGRIVHDDAGHRPAGGVDGRMTDVGGLYPVNDATSAIIQYAAGGVVSDAIVDMHTGVGRADPRRRDRAGSPSPTTCVVRVTAGTPTPVAVSVFSRSGLVNGTDTSSTTVALPNVTVRGSSSPAGT